MSERDGKSERVNELVSEYVCAHTVGSHLFMDDFTTINTKQWAKYVQRTHTHTHTHSTTPSTYTHRRTDCECLYIFNVLKRAVSAQSMQPP